MDKLKRAAVAFVFAFGFITILTLFVVQLSKPAASPVREVSPFKFADVGKMLALPTAVKEVKPSVVKAAAASVEPLKPLVVKKAKSKKKVAKKKRKVKIVKRRLRAVRHDFLSANDVFRSNFAA